MGLKAEAPRSLGKLASEALHPKACPTVDDRNPAWLYIQKSTKTLGVIVVEAPWERWMHVVPTLSFEGTPALKQWSWSSCPWNPRGTMGIICRPK